MKYRKPMAIVLALALLLTVLTGCAAKYAAESPLSLIHI